jgi:hypothetical protein
MLENAINICNNSSTYVRVRLFGMTMYRQANVSLDVTQLNKTSKTELIGFPTESQYSRKLKVFGHAFHNKYMRLLFMLNLYRLSTRPSSPPPEFSIVSLGASSTINSSRADLSVHRTITRAWSLDFIVAH